MEQQEAIERLGQLWAQAYTGRKQLVYSKTGTIGIDPATIAIFVQLAAWLIPKLMERCGPNEISLQANRLVNNKYRKASDDAEWVYRAVRKRLGFFRYYWMGGRRLVDSGVFVCSLKFSRPLLKANEVQA